MTTSLRALLRCDLCSREWTFTDDAATSTISIAAKLLGEFCPSCHAINPKVVRMRCTSLRERVTA